MIQGGGVHRHNEWHPGDFTGEVQVPGSLYKSMSDSATRQGLD
jgi:hypothetical protein